MNFMLQLVVMVVLVQQGNNMDLMRFTGIAKEIAKLSKDKSTQVGALVIDDDGNLLSTGFNGFPRGVLDHEFRYADRSIKLKYISHAESNAIAQAARNGVRLKGSNLLLTALYPCENCAKLIIQAGIKRIYAPVMGNEANRQWHEEKRYSSIMFHEAGVEVIEYDGGNQ